MDPTYIVYQDIAPGAKEEGIVSFADAQPFSAPADLQADSITPPKVATLEQNRWTLDGTWGIFPDDPSGYDFGLWSSSMSNANCEFETPPQISVEFTNQHKSVGVSLSFDEYGNDWASEVLIQWYNGTTLLHEETFTPNAVEYFCEARVEYYNRIVMTFTKTSKPYRYLKVTRIVYGITRTFEMDELDAINVFAEASPISETVEINTLDFELHAKTDVPFLFQRKQPLRLIHRETLQSVFYINEARQTGKNVFSISSTDEKGLLDEVTFYGGVYVDKDAAELIGDILGDYAFEISGDLGKVSGWLPVSTAREALMQVAFSVGAIVDTTCAELVRVFLPDLTPSAAFDNNRVYSGASVKTNALVTSVEVTEHAYSTGGSTSELFKGTVNGTSLVTFSEPAYNLSISGGTITESGDNYAVISGSGEVTLTGTAYKHQTRVVTVTNPETAATDVKKVVSVTDATLVSVKNSSAVAQRIYDYYQRREMVEADLILQNEKPGDTVTVETPFSGTKTGVIVSLDIDMARKKKARAVIACE